MSVAEAALGPLDDSRSSAGPGSRLREAREAVGLTAHDIAARLRLDPKVIRALENEEFEKLHGPTFVRGYLRGYARALDLPSAPIMEAYDRRGEQLPVLVRDIATGTEEVRSSDPPVRLATWAIVVVSVGLVVLWWQNQESVPQMAENTEQVLVTDTDPSTIASVFEQPPVPETAIIPTTPKAEPSPIEETPTVDIASEPAVTMLGVAEDTGADAMESAQPPPAEGEAPDSAPAQPPVPEEAAPKIVVTVPDLPPESPPQPEIDPVAEASAPAAPSAAPDGVGAHLKMRFEHESWVEVYGVGGRRLYYNLVKPGQTLDLNGEPPIKVLLGYARGVRVQYNGQSFDHKPFMSKGLARFTLGGGAVPAPNVTPEG